MTRKARRPKLYDDLPGTRVEPLGDGYEYVQRPDRSSIVRKRLSKAGQRKHARLDALGPLGYEVVSTKGQGLLVHPRYPAHFYTVAAAALHEGIA